MRRLMASAASARVIISAASLGLRRIMSALGSARQWRRRRRRRIKRNALGAAARIGSAGWRIGLSSSARANGGVIINSAHQLGSVAAASLGASAARIAHRWRRRGCIGGGGGSARLGVGVNAALIVKIIMTRGWRHRRGGASRKWLK